MTFEWEFIHVAYRVIDGQHTFCSADMRVAIIHADRAEAAARMVHLGKELSRWNVHVYITAYDRLGPELKALRKDMGEGAWITVAYDLGATPPARVWRGHRSGSRDPEGDGRAKMTARRLTIDLTTEFMKNV